MSMTAQQEGTKTVTMLDTRTHRLIKYSEMPVGNLAH